MKTYKISGGHLVDRETGETAEQIHGKLTSLSLSETENGTRHVNLELTDGEDVSVLRVKLYGDAAMKILRCLYGVTAYIHDAPVTIRVEEREGRRSQITVKHGERELVALGDVSGYADFRAAFVQRILGDVTCAVQARYPVAVIAIKNADGNDVVFDDADPGEVLGRINETVNDGRRGDVKFKKHVFTNPDLVTAFLSGARSMGDGRIYVTDNPTVIAALEEPLLSEPAPVRTASLDVPEDNEEA